MNNVITPEEWERERTFVERLEKNKMLSEWIDIDGEQTINKQGFYARTYILKNVTILYPHLDLKNPDVNYKGGVEMGMKKEDWLEMDAYDRAMAAKFYEWSVVIEANNDMQRSAWIDAGLGLKKKKYNPRMTKLPGTRKFFFDVVVDEYTNKIKQIPILYKGEIISPDEIVTHRSVCNLFVTAKHYANSNQDSNGFLPRGKKVTNYTNQIGSQHGRWSVRLAAVEVVEIADYGVKSVNYDAMVHSPIKSFSNKSHKDL